MLLMRGFVTSLQVPPPSLDWKTCPAALASTIFSGSVGWKETSWTETPSMSATICQCAPPSVDLIRPAAPWGYGLSGSWAELMKSV